MLKDLIGPVEVEGLRIYLHPEVYTPAEDTYMLLNACRRLARGKRVVDLGCGTGIVGIAAAIAGALEVIMIDINPYAVGIARLNSIENGVEKYTSIVQCDALKCLNSAEHVDLIAFNPPYLPDTRRERWIDYSWAGGLEGGELLEEAIETLIDLGFTGEILMVWSSATSRTPMDMLERAKFKLKVLDSTHKFFETIYLVYAVRR